MARKARPRARRPSIAVGGSNPYDELIRIIDGMMDDRLAEVMPRLGTVKGKDGRRVRVQPWGEDDAGDESHARDGGKNARDDDTVVLLPLGGGNYVALGPIVGHDGGGRDEMISGKEIERDAIEERHLKNNAVKGRHIEGGAIGKRELGRGVVERNMLDNSLISSLADASHIGRLDKRVDREKGRIDHVMKRLNKLDNQGEN